MLAVHDLTYTYDGRSPIQFTNFTVDKGEHCLLLGQSGSGKTTLLHLLGGLLRPTGGNIELNGTNLESLSEAQLDIFRGQHIGFIFQKNHLVTALTVQQNLLLAQYLAGHQSTEARAQEVLNRLGLSGYEHSKVTRLSHGQAQRVAIARALMNNPQFILADEPTSALDDKHCDSVADLLLEVAQENQATLLVATHDARLKSKIKRQLLLS